MGRAIGRAVRRGCAAARWGLLAGAWTACEPGSALRTQDEPLELGTDVVALTTDDGLGEAYRNFRSEFLAGGEDVREHLSFGFDPVLATERIEVLGRTPRGDVTLSFDENRILATLRDVPADEGFALWFVKNVDGPGKSVRFELGDMFFQAGRFVRDRSGVQTLDELVAGHVDFDFDFVAITRSNGHPLEGILASGARTLFEKRFYRERLGLPEEPVRGTLANDVETLDPLVRRGAELFFRETFAGNGRTCGTCHRAENNLTLDPAFIGTLPPSDPLFVAEFVPALSALEDPVLLRRFGLIRENVDGFASPATKFVQRATQHTFALSTSMGRGDIALFPSDGRPPDQRLGWSGDGAHGRGTLQEFGLGAVFQHFPRSLARTPGVDFRFPTQGELDALEAFQLFSGRQRNPNTQAMVFADANVEAGKRLFVGEGACVSCHRDLVAGRENHMVDTGVEGLSRALGLPVDGGFGTDGTPEAGFGTGRFNVPPLTEAADTAPFFHNGAVATLEEAIAFYTGPFFAASPGRSFSGVPRLDATQVGQLGAFLRVANALENMRQVEKRVRFVSEVRGPGNTRILELALADLEDALMVLTQKQLNAAAQHALRTAQLTVFIGRANPDELRPAYMAHALVWLAEAKRALVLKNPTAEF